MNKLKGLVLSVPNTIHLYYIQEGKDIIIFRNSGYCVHGQCDMSIGMAKEKFVLFLVINLIQKTFPVCIRPYYAMCLSATLMSPTLNSRNHLNIRKVKSHLRNSDCM